MPENLKVIFSAEKLKFNIGLQTLFDNAEFSVHHGERLGIVGRNGSGKSTLLKIIAGLEIAAQGQTATSRGTRIAFMPQEFSADGECPVYDLLHDGISYFEKLLADYENLPHSDSRHAQLETEINLHDAWQPERKIATVIEMLDIPAPDRICATLSGGEKRRVAFAQAVVSEPDLLLLDEPTNHLDAATITRLENYLANYPGTCIFVTHDRYFLDRVATRIIELCDGKIHSYPGNYADYIEIKSAREYAIDEQEAKRQAFLRSEVEWVRRSPKARLKRNMGRVKRYDETVAQNAPTKVREISLIIPPSRRLGNKVVELTNVSFAYQQGTPLIRNFNYEFQAGMRIGIVGRNGCGKTSLLRLLTGNIAPNTGTVTIADTVEFNYIDQNRIALNPANTVFDEIGEGGQTTWVGKDKISVWTYLRRFLFSDDRINTRIDRLSGGERARLMLAKILKHGGNFLILDEPTNDLDLSTLRLLEEALLDYDGCLVAVSHDRYFLNRICTHVIGFGNDGEIITVLGDYDNYLNRISAPPTTTKTEIAKTRPAQTEPNKPRKLKFSEKNELANMETKIATQEAEINRLETNFSLPDFFVRYGAQQQQLHQDLANAKDELERLYERWEELEKLNSAST